MAIILPHGITAPEIRVLQEFRRAGNAETLPIATLKAIKHPYGGGEAPVASLVEKGWLTADEAREQFTLTAKAREFLAIVALPEGEAAGGEDDEPAEIAQ
jgi:hypothetical protein